MTEQNKTPGTDAELDEILTLAYACTRVWEAWQYGTMSEDDFTPAVETEIRDDLIAWRDAAVRSALAAGAVTAGPVLGREQLGTALSALEDAADYRREYQDGDCTDCDENGYDPARPDRDKLCGDHGADEAVASMYDLLREELQEHQGRGEAATAAGTEGLSDGDRATSRRDPAWLRAVVLRLPGVPVRFRDHGIEGEGGTRGRRP